MTVLVTNDGALVVLRSFGVSFEQQTVLADVNLELPRRGLVTLVGPSASGKSTLLRTLAGLNDPHPGLSVWGEAWFDRAPLVRTAPPAPGEPRPGIGFVAQHARFFLDSVRENLVSALQNRASYDRAAQTSIVAALLERAGLGELVDRLDEEVSHLPVGIQRRVAIIRAVVAEPLVLMADEPTVGLGEEDASEVIALLRREAALRCVMFVTHNQAQARAAGGNVVLLAGGRVIEAAPADTFFSCPSTEVGASFVRTGTCPLPSPDARPEDLDEALDDAFKQPPLPASARAKSRFEGPRGFFWVAPGCLGGLPRPGIVEEVARDLDGLKHLGVTVLVTLEETVTVPPALLAQRGVWSMHFPIVDMAAPDLEACARFCDDVVRLTDAGAVIAMHCRAGLGRTGTMLAAQLVWQGASARSAIERLRALNPRCIQSQAQVDFLSSVEVYVRNGALAARALAAS